MTDGIGAYLAAMNRLSNTQPPQQQQTWRNLAHLSTCSAVRRDNNEQPRRVSERASKRHACMSLSDVPYPPLMPRRTIRSVYTGRGRVTDRV